jgi:hypothetical protein
LENLKVLLENNDVKLKKYYENNSLLEVKITELTEIIDNKDNNLHKIQKDIKR